MKQALDGEILVVRLPERGWLAHESKDCNEQAAHTTKCCYLLNRLPAIFVAIL